MFPKHVISRSFLINRCTKWCFQQEVISVCSRILPGISAINLVASQHLRFFNLKSEQHWATNFGPARSPALQVCSSPGPWCSRLLGRWGVRRQLLGNRIKVDKGCLGNLKWVEPRKKTIIGGWFSCSIFHSESCNAPLRPPCFCPCYTCFLILMVIARSTAAWPTSSSLVWIVFNRKEQCVNRRRFWIPPNWAVAACFLVFFLCYTTLTSFFSFFPVIIIYIHTLVILWVIPETVLLRWVLSPNLEGHPSG